MSDAFWVFGYGSLMWRPGFPHRRSEPALLRGAHRALCVFSHVHRGTPERPGLVLGLDRGGACQGLAFEVAPEDVADVVAYLRAREQANMVYHEAIRPVRLGSGERVNALVYVVDRAHPQYAGVLSVDEQARLVRQGVGSSGANPEYVRSTLAHLVSMGVNDRLLAAVVERL
jgi:cation transport protein ChaC